jgi:hypothetical protein
VRALSDDDMQRLCNLNFENEVAFVAATGTRENPQIVAHSCYFIDPSTNLAETAFMVSRSGGATVSARRCRSE